MPPQPLTPDTYEQSQLDAWARGGLPALDRGTADYDQLWNYLETKNNLPHGFMRSMANIEAPRYGQYDPSVTNQYGYRGLFQIGRDTAAGIGANYDQLTDPVYNSLYAARLADTQRKEMRHYMGDDTFNPTPEQMYFAHQQGSPVASQFFKNPNRLISSFSPTVQKQVLANNGKLSMTSQQFQDMFAKKYRQSGDFNQNYAPSVPFSDQWVPQYNASGDVSPGNFDQLSMNPFTGKAWSERGESTPPGATGGANGLGPTFNSINRMLPPSPYSPGRAGGGDIAGYDVAGLAFDRSGNPLGNTGVSRAMQEGLRSMYERYSNMDTSQFGTVDSSQFAGRYAYSGDLRPQDAAFLDENPGATVTREGRYVLPTDYASLILGLDPDASDYAGRYDTPGGPSLQDALFLQQNPSFTLARGGANTGYGYRLDPATGSYVPNTTGTGGTAQPPGNFTPNPAPNPNVFGNPTAAPNPSDINGFNTPPTPFQPLNQDYINASTIGYNPSAPVSNPSALGSTIPGFNDPGGSLYNPAPSTVASFGNPSFLGGLPSTPLGGSSPQSSASLAAGAGGGSSAPMVITVNPSSILPSSSTNWY